MLPYAGVLPPHSSCELQSWRRRETIQSFATAKQQCCFKYLQPLPVLILLGTETRAEQPWVSSGVQSDEA